MSDSNPTSDLQAVLTRIVDEANVRIKGGVLPNEIRYGLKQGISLLGLKLKDQAIISLAHSVLGPTPPQESKLKVAGAKVYGLASYGFRGLGKMMRLVQGIPFSPWLLLTPGR